MSADGHTPTNERDGLIAALEGEENYMTDGVYSDIGAIADGLLSSEWLAAHDAEVARAAAENAWDKSADRWYEFCQDEAATSDPDRLPTEPVNPYRKVATDE